MSQITDTRRLLGTSHMTSDTVGTPPTGGHAQEAPSVGHKIKSALQIVPLALTAEVAGVSSLFSGASTLAIGIGGGVMLASAPLGLTIGAGCALLLGTAKLGCQYKADRAPSLQ